MERQYMNASVNGKSRQEVEGIERVNFRNYSTRLGTSLITHAIQNHVPALFVIG